MSNNDRGFDPIAFVINIPSQQDPIMDQLLADDCDHLTPTKLGSKRPQQISRIGDGEGGSNKNYQNKQKREMHRESEKLRRQEMAKQYASLRALLPLQYSKGKRSISDHVQEAVSYVNHLRQRIKDLDLKREKLKKKLSDDHASSDHVGVNEPAGVIGKEKSNNICCEGNSANVTVGSCSCGVEILIRLRDEGRIFPLSKLMEALDEQNLRVVSCISFRLDQRLLYTIQCEASNQTPVDLSMLQILLTDAISTIFG